MRIDLLCQIVDNFGDAGIAWRLGCQLADELSAEVTLWIDKPDMLQAWQHDRRARQSLPETSAQPTPAVNPLSACDQQYQAGDVLIAVLAAEASDTQLSKLARAGTLLIRYEHLSAEGWIDDFHRRPSLHPNHRLTSHYFYPGYTTASGGLLREQGLIEQRDQYRRRSNANGIRSALSVSVFGYPDAALRLFVHSLQQQHQDVQLKISQPVLDALPGVDDTGIQPVRWLSMPAFDQLLWDCDINLVRGEDSWVRAQWAGVPFLWQAYRQPDDAHQPKLEAFLARLLDPAISEPGLQPARDAIAMMMHALNPPTAAGTVGNPDVTIDTALQNYMHLLPQIRQVHRAWTAHLVSQPSLMQRLAAFMADHPQ